MNKTKERIDLIDLSNKLNLTLRKLERKRMRELVFKYPHIRDNLLRPPVKTVTHGNYVELTCDLLWEEKLSTDEQLAARDWKLVLEGKSPNTGNLWKTLEGKMGPINSFKELSDKVVSLKYEYYGM